ncbi:hypothetical protein Q6272_29835, partial [Klebsiella pneumoniae]|nr:hypothetical protein [Klebsiella pneumoniae]
NKDNQEDKEPLFDAADTLRDSLRAFADMIPAIKPKHAIMREAALRGFSTATDLADYLVRRGHRTQVAGGRARRRPGHRSAGLAVCRTCH